MVRGKGKDVTYQAAAVELDENGVFAWFEGLGD